MARSIRFGIAPITEDPPHGENMVRVFDEIVSEARLAESVGFDSCLITEHHQQLDGYFPNPLIVAAGVARETSIIRVGTCIALAPLYSPVRLAEDAALVDILSKGRLILGVGAGYAPDDLDAFGIQARDRGTLFEDCVSFVQRAWTERDIKFNGNHYDYSCVNVTPKPVQSPRPEIWCGGWSPGGLRRAAELGDRWIIDGLHKMGTASQFAKLYREAARRVGKEPRVAVLRECWVAGSERQAREQYAEHVTTSHRFYFESGGYESRYDPWVPSVQTAGALSFDHIAEDRFIMGSPYDCIREIERWNEIVGVDYFILRFRHPTGPSHDMTLRSIKLFGDAVLGYFN